MILKIKFHTTNLAARPALLKEDLVAAATEGYRQALQGGPDGGGPGHGPHPNYNGTKTGGYRLSEIVHQPIPKIFFKFKVL